MSTATVVYSGAWDSTCEKSLAETWKATSTLWKAANKEDREEIRKKWEAKVDRLYINAGMPTSTYSRYLVKSDALFIGYAAKE